MIGKKICSLVPVSGTSVGGTIDCNLVAVMAAVATNMQGLHTHTHTNVNPRESFRQSAFHTIRKGRRRWRHTMAREKNTLWMIGDGNGGARMLMWDVLP